MQNHDQLTIERLGGFGGFGGPHLKSKGELSLSGLSAEDLRAVDRLFPGDRQVSAPKTDGFRYRITRWSGSELQTIEVSEEEVPPFIQSAVKDSLE